MSITKKEESLILELFGKRIRELRKNAYDSQEAFAYVSDIPRAQYGRYEKGTNMTILSLCKILKKHGLTLEDFFKEGFEEINVLLSKKDK